MSDFRVFVQPVETDPQEIRLSPEESHHLINVNRCQRGDPVVAFDGRGREWNTECSEASRHAAVLRVRNSRQAPPLGYEITLAQSLPKGATMDDIVRQATEVGAARIVPVVSERTQVQLDGERAEKKVAKWRTAAVEAAKQCGNPWLPEISPLTDFAALLNSPPTYDLKLIASLQPGATSLKAVLTTYAATHNSPPKRVLWLIGPEGDFSPAEMSAALQAGCQPITLGPLVLRSDTAALYALSILAHELQSAQ